MNKKVIVYFGMGFLPDNNAVACREQALGCIIKEIGYIPVLIGINREVPFGKFEKKSYQNIVCYDVKYAGTLTEKIRDLSEITNALISILEDIGIERIKCFIMQDYQFGPMRRMERYCRINDIGFIADVMDWFVPNRDYSLIKNISKTIDTQLRMHWLYPRFKNKICISNKFVQYFSIKASKSNTKNNLLVLPCTCSDFIADNQYNAERHNNITITFAGFLGRKCEKEKLDWIIKALYENKSDIELNVIGLCRKEFILKVPDLENCITDRIHFLGYLPRKECIKVLCSSDFSIIARKKNKLTEYGFSSKICEAFACGIPVIATNNSDNGIYIKDGENGFICEENYGALKQLLKKVGDLDRKNIEKMHDNLINNNPLSVMQYTDVFSEFIESIEV